MSDTSSLRSLLWSRLHGGTIGGALAGLVIAIGYYTQEPDLPPAAFAEIVLFAMFVGAAAAISAQLGMSGARHLAGTREWPSPSFTDVAGGALGCLAGVTLLGIVGGLLFGGREEEPVNLLLLAGLSLVGMCVAIALYDTGGLWWQMALWATLPGLVIFPLVGLTFKWLDIDLVAPNNPKEWILDGASIGAILGFAMGLQMGLGLFLYRRFGLGTTSGRASRPPSSNPWDPDVRPGR